MIEASFNATPTVAANFRVGRILRRSFATWFHHFVNFIVMAAIPLSPVLVGSFLVQQPTVVAGRITMPSQMGGIFALGAMVIVLVFFSQAVVVHGAFQDLRGRSFGIGEALRRGFSRFLPIVGLLLLAILVYLVFALFMGLIAVFFVQGTFKGLFAAKPGTGLIVLGIVVTVAALLLIVAACMLFCRLFLFLPACVIERLGLLASLRRSAALTKGHRWRVFGLTLLILFVSLAGQKALEPLSFISSSRTIPIISSFLWLTITEVLSAIISAVAYYDLRVAKDGIDVDRIAAVFD